MIVSLASGAALGMVMLVFVHRFDGIALNNYLMDYQEIWHTSIHAPLRMNSSR